MTVRKAKTAVALAAVTLLATGVIVRMNDARGQNAPARAPGTELGQKAQARVKAAENVLTSLEKRIEGQAEPFTPSFIELLARCHRRLAEARIEATDDPAARVRAAEQYLEQSRRTLAMLEARRKVGADVTYVEVALGTYEVADAEYLLVKMQER